MIYRDRKLESVYIYAYSVNDKYIDNIELESIERLDYSDYDNAIYINISGILREYWKNSDFWIDYKIDIDIDSYTDYDRQRLYSEKEIIIPLMRAHVLYKNCAFTPDTIENAIKILIADENNKSYILSDLYEWDLCIDQCNILEDFIKLIDIANTENLSYNKEDEEDCAIMAKKLGIICDHKHINIEDYNRAIKIDETIAKEMFEKIRLTIAKEFNTYINNSLEDVVYNFGVTLSWE
jgi:hypothetical protein